MSIKDFFRSEWPSVAEAWERWQYVVQAQSASATQWIVELAGVREGMRVLDLASGVGEPAVALARRVGPAGRVIATDLVAGALEFIDRAACVDGLDQLTTQPADMEALPFPDGSFDAVTCRLGLMFCPCPEQALAEARRVLRTGGRAAFIVWGDPDQPLFAATLGEVRRALSPIPSGDAGEAGGPEAPQPFRLAAAGGLSALLARVGFSCVAEEERVVPWPFAGSGLEMWQMFYALAGDSFRLEITKLDEDARRALVDRIAARLDAHRRGHVVDPTARLIGAVGVAP